MEKWKSVTIDFRNKEVILNDGKFVGEDYIVQVLRRLNPEDRASMEIAQENNFGCYAAVDDDVYESIIACFMRMALGKE